VRRESVLVVVNVVEEVAVIVKVSEQLRQDNAGTAIIGNKREK